MEVTRLSSKGQVVIPKQIRAAHHWKVGVEFLVTEVEEGILLKPVPPAFPHTDIEDAMGCIDYQGKRVSLKDMEEAIKKGAQRWK